MSEPMKAREPMEISDQIKTSESLEVSESLKTSESQEASDQMDEALRQLFAAQAVPPTLREWQLQRLAHRREQKRLLMAVSLLSCLSTMVAICMALLLLEQHQRLGEAMLGLIVVSLFSAVLLTAAILRTERPTNPVRFWLCEGTGMFYSDKNR